MSGDRPIAGRTVITARAIERVVRAVAADQFGVVAGSVSADLTDEGGRLDLAIRTTIRVVSIGRIRSDPMAIDRSGGSVLERATRSEVAIAEQVGSITGSTVPKVGVRFTRADIRQERRVR